jgi:hypothetical protein
MILFGFLIVIKVPFYLVLISFFSFNLFASKSISPQKIMEDWQACQTKDISSMSCQATKRLALNLHEIIEGLRDNPQKIGLEIMYLQYEITNLKQQKKLAKAENLESKLDSILNTVGWLESPK